MFELGHRNGFALKSTSRVLLTGEKIMQNFDGHVALKLSVFGAIHDTHAALADQLHNFVALELWFPHGGCLASEFNAEVFGRFDHIAVEGHFLQAPGAVLD
jgi:hypothetical protein